MLVLASPAFAQTTRDDAPAMVSVSPGLGGRWAVQQWAPLRLTFRDPGPVQAVEIYSADAGPRFRAAAVPSPTGVSVVDVDVYPQLASTQWIVELIRPDGARRLVPIELTGVAFSGYVGPLDNPAAPSGSTFRHPPQQMRLAAAASGQAVKMEDLDAMAVLATGRSIELDGPTGRQTVQLADTFAPPDDSPLIWPQNEIPPFYQHVWRADLARPMHRPIALALAILAGGLLPIATIGLLLRRRPIIATLASVLVMVLAAGTVYPTQPPLMQARMELVIHAGDRVAIGPRPGASPVGLLPAPVRRQQWQAAVAYREGAFELPLSPARPTGRLLVVDASARPDVTLPAVSTPTAGERVRVVLARGQRLAMTSIDYFIDDSGTMRRIPASQPGEPARLTWANWRAPVHAAYVVSDTRAVAVADITGRAGQLAIPPGDGFAWDTVFAPEASDTLDVRLCKRMLEYWTTSVVHGGRHWLVGFEPRPARQSAGVLELPAMYAIDLGSRQDN